MKQTRPIDYGEAPPTRTPPGWLGLQRELERFSNSYKSDKSYLFYLILSHTFCTIRDRLLFPGALLYTSLPLFFSFSGHGPVAVLLTLPLRSGTMVVFVDHDTHPLDPHALRPHVNLTLQDSCIAVPVDQDDSPKDPNRGAFSAALNCYPYAYHPTSWYQDTLTLQNRQGNRPLPRLKHPPRPLPDMSPDPRQHPPLPGPARQTDPALRERVHRSPVRPAG